MAQREFQLEQQKLCCSICLDILKDPVTIPCGHNYCMNCIQGYWDEEDIQSCPQCRRLFIPRPVLLKNTMMADLLEELKRTGLQAAPADLAGPEDGACESPDKHKLVDASEQLQENICTRHNEVMKIFCRTDQQCICYLCSMDEHKGHDTVSAAAERTERQKELEARRQEIQQRIQDREKDVTVLQQEGEAINHSADTAVEVNEKVFTDLIRLIEKRSSDAKQQIRSQQEIEVSRVKELQEKVEEEISELRSKDAELEQLSRSEDHNQFLRKYPLLSGLGESTESPSPNICPLRYFDGVPVAVLEARDQLQDLLSEEWIKISHALSNLDVLLSQTEPKTRDDFFKYSQRITLDPNTAHRRLLLSEGNRKATNMIKKRSYSRHPDRFISRSQVLSQESLSGRHYWEVEWSGPGVYIAVTYKDISRRGVESQFGNNNKSWALVCSDDGYEFNHNKTSVFMPSPESSTVGVYLDHRGGVLCFYSISENMTLLHRVQTTFTQPLYAGLRVYSYSGVGSSAETKDKS